MNTVVLDGAYLLCSQMIYTDTIYVFESFFDLLQGTVTIPYNCILEFKGGKVSNGTLIGNNTRIINENNGIIFDNIELSYVLSDDYLTGWLGECRDVWFAYDENSKCHYKLVKSVCQFEICRFSKRTYYIEIWNLIHLRAFGCQIEGGGAVLIIIKDKGETSIVWGGIHQYNGLSLFWKEHPNSFVSPFDPDDHDYYKNGDKAGTLSVSDLVILDDDTMTGDPLFGANVFSSSIISYAIFYGSGSKVFFKNVSYYGMGVLWKDYNYRVFIEEVIIDRCKIRTCEFAIELGNLLHTDSSHSSLCPMGGRCNSVIIRDCDFFCYLNNPYVGPISIVSSGMNVVTSITRSLLIERTSFESQKEANLELAGCETVEIRYCVFKSVQCSSEIVSYHVDQLTDAPINRRMVVTNCFFSVSDELMDPHGGLRICSGDLQFVHNVVYVDFSRSSSGAFALIGYGDNEAVLTGNSFIISGTNESTPKTMILYRNTRIRLKGNNYLFLDETPQGYEVHIDSQDQYYELEVEDDPRFRNRGGGDYYAWQIIPSNHKTSEGLLAKGVTLELDDSLPSNQIVEFDLQAYANGTGRQGTHNFLSFKSGSANIYAQTYYGVFCVQVGQDSYSSGSGMHLALPILGFDTLGKDLGTIKIVFWNKSLDQPICTLVLLYINDFLVDSFSVNCNIFEHELSSFKLYGSPYLRIKRYRIRQYGKIVKYPRVHNTITMNPNDGYTISGTSALRPASPEVGFMFFDTSLNKPVFYTGNGWIDSSGNSV